jgi:hypothetical protein
MALARELGGAVALALGRADGAAGRPVAERVEELAWLPAAGLVLGTIVGLVGSASPAPWAGLVGALLLAAAHGTPRRWLLRGGAALVSAAALLSLTPAARMLALVVAPMLARWAVVVQCYGGRAAPDAAGIATLAGRAQFREFGIASVTALATTLVLLDAVGLAIVLACALATLAIRVLAYRRAAGLGDDALEATAALVEALAMLLLASIGSLLGRG